jgi:hypothetical protein
MREVAVDRFVAAPPAEVARVLTPERLVVAEGSFTVREVRDDGDATLIAAGRAGVELLFRFEPTEDGLAYEQLEGPLERLTTTISYVPENEGTRLSARSSVAVRGPGVLDRLAAWKRRGELRRALRTIDAEL